VDIRGVAEHVDDLERRRHLAGDPVGVDGVDDGDGRPGGQVAHDVEGGVEIPLDLDDGGAVHERLSELPEGDVTLGDEDGAPHSRPGGVGGRRGGGVACGGAHDDLGLRLGRLRDGKGHAAVLEGPGRVGALDLEPHLGPHPLGEAARPQEGRAAFLQGHDRRRFGDGEKGAVLLDDTSPGTQRRLRSLGALAHVLVGSGPMTRSNDPILSTESSCSQRLERRQEVRLEGGNG